MTKTPITLQDLRRRLYVKAKAEPSWRFWGLYAHVCKPETLRAAYELAKQNDGAPGTDGVTFEAIEVDGVERFLDQLREELVQRSYRPQRPRKVGIPKEGGKVRQLSIPSIRDRVAQSGAWQTQSSRARPMSSTSTCDPISIRCDITSYWRKWLVGSATTRCFGSCD